MGKKGSTFYSVILLVLCVMVKPESKTLASLVNYTCKCFIKCNCNAKPAELTSWQSVTVAVVEQNSVV